jgi:thioredoxin reductase
MTVFDVIIVGAGPAGLTSAANTAYRGLNTLIIEKQDSAGGLPTLLFPDKIIKDHPGFPVGILGKELSRMLFLQAKNAGANIKFDEEVLTIQKKNENLIEVKTSQGKYESKRVILCTGIYNIPKKLDILIGYSGPNIHYKVENLGDFKGKNVVIIGGGDNAFDTAVQLNETAKTVTVLVKEKYAKAKENTVKLASEEGVQILYNTEAVKIKKDIQGTLSGIQISSTELKQEKILRADRLFIAIGFQRVRSFYENNGFELLKDGSVKVDEHLQTNIRGVYAAGDITGEIRLIAIACAEGITAAINAFEELKQPYWLH